MKLMFLHSCVYSTLQSSFLAYCLLPSPVHPLQVYNPLPCLPFSHAFVSALRHAESASVLKLPLVRRLSLFALGVCSMNLATSVVLVFFSSYFSNMGTLRSKFMFAVFSFAPNLSVV